MESLSISQAYATSFTKTKTSRNSRHREYGLSVFSAEYTKILYAGYHLQEYFQKTRTDPGITKATLVSYCFDVIYQT